MKKFFLFILMMTGLTLSSQIFVTEGFEATTTPPGWTYTGFARTTAAGYPCNGSAAIRRYFTTSATSGDAVYTSMVSNGNDINVQFSYSARPNSTTDPTYDGFMIVDYSTDGGTNYTLLGSFVTFASTEISCATFTGSIPSGSVPVNSDFKLRISGTQTGTTNWYLTVDDVSIIQTATCYQPTNVIGAGTGTTTADVSWTAAQITPGNGYEIYYSTSNTPPTAASTPQVTGVVGTSTTLNGLTPSSHYYVWVRSACSSTDISAWSLNGDFFTNCAPYTVPYFENFDNTAVGSTTNNNAPLCWTYYETSGSVGYGYVYTSTTIPYSTPNCYRLFNGTNTTNDHMLISPQTTNLSNGNNRVRFFARGGSTTGDLLQVGTMSDPTNPSTFSLIGSALPLTSVMTEFIINIPVGTHEYIVFRHGLASNSDNVYIDDIYVEPIPSCIKPTDPIVSNITSSTIQLSWTASPTTPANGYDIYYNTTGVIPDANTAPILTGQTSPTTVSGFSPDTTYHIWVRANCSATDQSFWTSEQVMFTTQCNDTTAPYSENFDTTSGGSTTINNTPTCWSYYETPGTSGYGYVYNSTANSNSPANSYRLYNSSETTDDLMLISPPTSNLTGGYRVRFYAKGGDATGDLLEVGTISDPMDPTTFTIIGSPISLSNTYAEYIVYLPITGTVKYFAFRHGLGETFDDVYIDDVVVEANPSCVQPFNVMLDTFSNTSAQISWTPSITPPVNGYDIYYSTSNTPPDASTVPILTGQTSPATLSPLTPNTTYYVWVRSDCGANGQSIWSEFPVVFTTLCNVFTVPYSENFDTTSTGTSSNNNAPDCWTYYETGSTGYGYVSGSAANVFSAPNSYYLYRAASTTGDLMLISPQTANLSNGANRVRFFAKSTNSGTLEVGTMSDPTDPSTFVILGTAISLTPTFDEYFFNIPSGTNSYVAFKNTSPGTGNAYIDDIYVEVIPTCVKPSDVVVTNVSPNTIDISWTAPTTPPTNGYQVYYSTTNIAPTAGTVLDANNSVSSTTTSATISGLSVGATYYIWVRSNCSSSDQSEWISFPVVYTTQCNPFTVPYSENFDTTSTGTSSNNNAPACWTYYETGSTGYGYVYGTATNVLSTPNSYFMYRSSTTTGDVMLISPSTIDLTDANRVRFFAKSTSSNPGIIEVGTMSNPADPSSFVIIGSPKTLTATFTEYIFNIPPGTHTYFAIKNTSPGATGNAFIDDIFVEDMATCVEPTNVTISNIGENSAVVTWTPSLTPVSTYEIYYSTTNTPPTAPNVTGISGTATSHQLNGLLPDTMYYVWVRSNCSVTDQSIWTPVESFTTLCDAPAILTTSGGTVCGSSGSTTLSATADPGATFNWYDVQTGGTSLGTGNTFTTPVINQTTTYYVGASSGFTTVSAGNMNAISTTGYTLEAGVFFDALTDFVIQGVYIYPYGSGGTGTVTIALQNGSVSPATTIQSVTVNVMNVATSSATATKTFVPLNFSVSAGSNYKLMMLNVAGGVNGLVRESGSSWGSYPITTPGVLSITNGNCCSGNTTSNSYYYFYDWQVNVACESPREPVVAAVDQNCLGTSEVNQEEFNIYPNPFDDVINISNVRKVKSIAVMDMSGRLIRTIEKPASQINLGYLQKGMYILVLQLEDGKKQSMKVIKK